MANTFKVVTFAAEPASAGTAYTMYTVAGSTTTVVLGLILTNIHTTAVTVEVELVSDTGSRGGANNVTNGTSFLAKDVSIPAGSSLEFKDGYFDGTLHCDVLDLNGTEHTTIEDPTALAIALGQYIKRILGG